MSIYTITPLSSSRRGFLRGISLSGLALSATVLPAVSAMAMDPVVSRWQGQHVHGVNFIDEALGNHPHYAAPMGFGRGHLLAQNDSRQQAPHQDPQLLA